MGQFGENAIMPRNGDPRALFTENLNYINTQNVLFLEGELTYSLSVNTFSALSFEEFAGGYSGMGVFSNEFTTPPEFDSRGELM